MNTLIKKTTLGGLAVAVSLLASPEHANALITTTTTTTDAPITLQGTCTQTGQTTGGTRVATGCIFTCNCKWGPSNQFTYFFNLNGGNESCTDPNLLSLANVGASTACQNSTTAVPPLVTYKFPAAANM